MELVMCLGSNCGDRERQLLQALELLRDNLLEVRWSSIYETPCALNHGKDYLNLVVSGRLESEYEGFATLLKKYECISGRNEECRRNGDVPIDIDIVIADGEIKKEWDFRQQFFKTGFQQLMQNC